MINDFTLNFQMIDCSSLIEVFERFYSDVRDVGAYMLLRLWMLLESASWLTAPTRNLYRSMLSEPSFATIFAIKSIRG